LQRKLCGSQGINVESGAHNSVIRGRSRHASLSLVLSRRVFQSRSVEAAADDRIGHHDERTARCPAEDLLCMFYRKGTGNALWIALGARRMLCSSYWTQPPLTHNTKTRTPNVHDVSIRATRGTWSMRHVELLCHEARSYEPEKVRFVSIAGGAGECLSVPPVKTLQSLAPLHLLSRPRCACHIACGIASPVGYRRTFAPQLRGPIRRITWRPGMSPRQQGRDAAPRRSVNSDTVTCASKEYRGVPRRARYRCERSSRRGGRVRCSKKLDESAVVGSYRPAQDSRVGFEVHHLP